MDTARLKEYIVEHDLIPNVLEHLGCHHIRRRKGGYSCGNPDGDNPTAITVYDHAYLTAINYTRNIAQGKAVSTDLFSLVEFFEGCSFFASVRLVCEWIGLDYYHDFDEELPESLRVTRLIRQLQSGGHGEEERPLKPIPETILSYYKPYVNDLFATDGISYATQRLFEIGYDAQTNRITIPIRDELGTLVGVKGRLFQREVEESQLKYLYLEPCARSQILYGLDKTYDAIRRAGYCFVGEAEKSCMQLWDMGFPNSVAAGGKKVTAIQIEKLTRLCVDLVFLFDKDVPQIEIEQLASRFVSSVNLYAVIDRKRVLEEKESPTDQPEKFRQLLKQCLIKIQ